MERRPGHPPLRRVAALQRQPWQRPGRRSRLLRVLLDLPGGAAGVHDLRSPAARPAAAARGGQERHQRAAPRLREDRGQPRRHHRRHRPTAVRPCRWPVCSPSWAWWWRGPAGSARCATPSARSSESEGAPGNAVVAKLRDLGVLPLLGVGIVVSALVGAVAGTAATWAAEPGRARRPGLDPDGIEPRRGSAPRRCPRDAHAPRPGRGERSVAERCATPPSSAGSG